MATLIASLGCHSATILRDGPDLSMSDRLAPGTLFPGTGVPRAIETDLRSGSSVLGARLAASDLNGIWDPSFRNRVLTRQATLQVGPAILPTLVEAYGLVPVGSHRGATLAFLVEQIQRHQTPAGLIHELTEQRGLRQRSAVRAATRLGPDAVPTLLGLLTHSDPDVRREVVQVLRQLTGRHPSLTGRGVVHAVRVWRAWYDTMRENANPMRPPAPMPVPHPRREPAFPDLTVSVSM